MTASRPLVVLVPDLAGWVLGAWAREIASAGASECDFAIFPYREIAERPEMFAALTRSADVVHCLSPWHFPAIAERVRGDSHLELVASVHHVRHVSDVRACFEADRIAVMCEQTRETLQLAGVAPERMRLVRKGVDRAFLEPRDRATARRRLALPPDAFLVGCAAKATSDHDGRKGLDVLGAAVLQLGKLPGTPVQLVVVGPGFETSLLGAVAGPVHRLGSLPEASMPDFFGALDVYVSTARLEGGPMPVFEAMACGTPVVCTPVGMVRDLAEDGVDALFVPPGDAERTAAALDRLRCDPQLAAALARNAGSLVRRRLDPRETGAQALALYGLKERPPRREEVGGPTRVELAALTAELEARDRARDTEAPAASLAGRARAWWRRRRAIGAARRLEIAHIDLEALKAGPARSFLDLGCGVGQLSLPLRERGHRLASLDVHRGRLHESREAARLRGIDLALLAGDGRSLPFRDGAFDVAFCREVLEHVDDPGAVLAEIHRVLEPGARLCVSVPSAHTERYFERVDSTWLEMAGHVHVFTRDAMRALLETSGFRLTDVRGRGSFYTLFWFVHTLARTRHDGTGRILNNAGLSRAIRRGWSWLGEPITRALVRVGDAVVPKSYVYYAERVSEPAPPPRRQPSAARATR